jgi:diaminopimelate decarboxylase
MDHFAYRHGELCCEDVPVARIAAEVGTPLYVYSRATILHHYRALAEAFEEVDPLICYSVKANGNLSILRLLAEAGAGFDVVSGGELHRALKAGADADRIVFAGVGKTDVEMEAALDAGIRLFDVESEAELEALAAVAERLGVVAPVALRVNPDVDPHTHTYITTGKRGTKFGLDFETAFRLVCEWPAERAARLTGLHMHIGSQITEVEPYVEALKRVGAFIGEAEAAGHAIEHLNLGGGFGIFYRDHAAPPAAAFAQALLPLLRALQSPKGRRGHSRPALRRQVILEPGRFIVGNAGILLTRVTFIKPAGDRRFVIVDAGMNDLIRPTLYQAYHKVWPVRAESGPPDEAEGTDGTAPAPFVADVVGPICESGDFFAKDRALPPVERGDLLSIFSAGAYGMSMASNYNARPRAAEVLVEGASWRLIRRRETYDDLLGPERV